MAGEYSVSGLAVPESLDRVQDLLGGVRADHPEVDENDVAMFETAIVEIHGNVVQHARPEGRVVYAFSLEVLEDRIVGYLTDTGSTAPDLTGTKLVDELEESGRGLWLARSTLDELDYVRTADRNTWRMVRLRSHVR